MYKRAISTHQPRQISAPPSFLTKWLPIIKIQQTFFENITTVGLLCKGFQYPRLNKIHSWLLYCFKAIRRFFSINYMFRFTNLLSKRQNITGSSELNVLNVYLTSSSDYFSPYFSLSMTKTHERQRKNQLLSFSLSYTLVYTSHDELQ